VIRRRMVENKRSDFGRAEAEKIRETFQDQPWKRETKMPWGWPKSVREIGVGMAVMYRSDKWKKPGKYESYKHICESHRPWRLFAAPGFAIEDGVRVHGHSTSLHVEAMPTSFAVLALFLGLQCRLFGTDGHLPAGDDGFYEVTIPKAKLCAGRTTGGDLFLCVYVEKEGPKLFLFGDELDVERDGIVG
jgi:hypothetical protein